VRQALLTRELVKRSTNESLGRITISLGVSVYRRGDTASSIVERADNALLQAKRRRSQPHRHRGRGPGRREGRLSGRFFLSAASRAAASASSVCSRRSTLLSSKAAAGRRQ
jgi:GGDEF domain-containing protein